MIEKRTVVDQVETTPGGTIQIRLRKEAVEEGKVLSYEFHRTALAPGIPLDSQMAQVNAHLKGMDYPAVIDVSRIQRIVAVEHTAAVVAAYRAKMAAK